VIQTVLEKFTYRDCEKISQPPAPFHVIPRGLFGPSLLAMILFEKLGQHQPLNRQCERFAREGVEISLSTAADMVGTATGVLKPLHDLLEAHVQAAQRLHGDDTRVPVLAKGKTDTGRIWTYVRDDRPFGGKAPPGAVYYYSRDRRGEHPVAHLAGYTGILQADAYGGYNALYESKRRPGPVLDAICWVHARRRLAKSVVGALKPARGRKRACGGRQARRSGGGGEPLFIGRPVVSRLLRGSGGLVGGWFNRTGGFGECSLIWLVCRGLGLEG
jgi:transposase